LIRRLRPARRAVRTGSSCSKLLASRVGFEPTTKGLKVPCSATELPARDLKRNGAAARAAVATIART
jgi:hypothetical protein